MKLRRFPKSLFAACLVAAAFPPCASAGPERDDNEDGQSKREAAAAFAERASAFRAEAFRIADKDADGYLSAAEFTELPAVMAALRRQRAFERLDADGDGQLTQEELDSAKWRGVGSFSKEAQGDTPRMKRPFTFIGGAREGFLRMKDPAHPRGDPPRRR